MRIYPVLGLVFLFMATARGAVEKDVEYGRAAGESLRLDVSVPEGAGLFPAAILVHGGGWTAGDKSGGKQRGYMAPMEEPLSAAGFAWFSINYRLAPKYPHPVALEDVWTAVRWVKARAGHYHLDPNRIVLAGESAGGQLVSLATVRADASTRVAATIVFYGPSDLVAETKKRGAFSPSFAALTGRLSLDPETWKALREISPITYVKPGLPPFLLVHGTADQSVSYEQSVMLQKSLRAAGDTCELITIPNGPHGMLPWSKLVPDFKEQVVAWIVKTVH